MVGIWVKDRLVQVDDEDETRVREHNADTPWTVKFVGGKYRVIDRNGLSIGRFILGVTGDDKVYHKNGDALDARRENLYVPGQIRVPVSRSGYASIKVRDEKVNEVIANVSKIFVQEVQELVKEQLAEQKAAWDRVNEALAKMTGGKFSLGEFGEVKIPQGTIGAFSFKVLEVLQADPQKFLDQIEEAPF